MALHTTESRLHPMLNHGMAFTFAGQKNTPQSGVLVQSLFPPIGNT